tara:strand:- start:63 stop:188 length:126 start_codon:yes stop_codon:yes gene_type:complete
MRYQAAEGDGGVTAYIVCNDTDLAFRWTNPLSPLLDFAIPK